MTFSPPYSALLDSPSACTTADNYRAVRQTTQELTAPLSAEDCQVQSMPDASPAKWHLAHTTWFFETFLLERFDAGHSPFDPAFRVLFNSYYTGVGERHPRPQRGLVSRPALQTVYAYRAHVDARMQALIASPAGRDPEFEALLTLGLHHEQQHQELILMDVKHMLSCNPLQPAYAAAPARPARAAQALQWVAFAGGQFTIGHARNGFAFDNETPAHDVLLRPFSLAHRLVTNAEYQAFVDDDGYRRPEFWLSLGWDTRNAQGWQAPLYWHEEDGCREQFTLSGRQHADPSAPVAHLSYFEADAYARWAGARLPSEAEWECATAQAEPAANMFEGGALQPLAPADAVAPGTLQQMYGDLWEWTSSPYAAYPGFRPNPGLVGEYNGKFMCNQYVLRGGSFATPASHIRPTYRNFFPPEARWQFSGLRLARDS